MIRPIDELNNMSSPPEEYFGEMGLTEEQIAERIEFTEEANDIILDAMYLFDTMHDYSAVDYDAVTRQLDDAMLALIAKYMAVDEYLRTYSDDFSQNFVDATIRHEDQDWYLSEDRALFNAENSANDTINYKEYVKALEEGKTHKKWISKHDPKVRHTHMLVDGQEIPIEETFVVGDALMRFPKDYELAFDAPQETVNCRCRIKYFGKGNPKKVSVENYRSNGTIESEMFRKGYTHRKTTDSGSKIIDKPTYHRIVNPAVKAGAHIQIADGEVLERLIQMDATAATYGTTIIFRQDATVSDVLEEVHHFFQNKNGLNVRYGHTERTILNEIDAKKYVLSMAEKYNIPKEELMLTENQLVSYQKQMEEMIRNGIWTEPN